MKHWRLITSMAVALVFWPQIATAKDLASSGVGVWKLTGFSTLDVKEHAIAAPPANRVRYNELKGPFLAKINSALK